MLEFEEDIEDKVIDILKRCCDCYFNTGSFYTLSNEDVKNLRELNIDINQYEVNDEIYDNVYFKLKKIYPSNVFSPILVIPSGISTLVTASYFPYTQ